MAKKEESKNTSTGAYAFAAGVVAGTVGGQVAQAQETQQVHVKPDNEAGSEGQVEQVEVNVVEPEENVVVVEKPDNVAEVTVESLWEDISDNSVIAPEPAVYGPAPTPDNGDDDLIFPDDDLFPDDLNVMYGPPTDCDLMDGDDIMA